MALILVIIDVQQLHNWIKTSEIFNEGGKYSNPFTITVASEYLCYILCCELNAFALDAPSKYNCECNFILAYNHDQLGIE